MDIDRFVATNEPTWLELERLLRRAGRRPFRLPHDDQDRLVALYERVSTHLSYARTEFGDPGLNARLTALVATAAACIYGTRALSARGVVRFFSHTFPGALWHIRPFLVAGLLFLIVPAVAGGTYLSSDKAALARLASPAAKAAYQKAAVDYYSEQPSAQFASQVFTNNVRVAAFAFAFGIALGLPSVYLLATNGVQVGVILALFYDAGRGAEMWGLLLPHGLIELSAVIVAGAAGMRLGWTIIDPGDRPRAPALVEEGRRAVALVMGTAAMLLVAGSIEGFVTGSSLPTAVRVGIGVSVEVAFVTYAVVFGRRAKAEGVTGMLGTVTA